MWFNRPFEWTTLDERVISSFLQRYDGQVTITAGFNILTGVPNDFDDQVNTARLLKVLVEAYLGQQKMNPLLLLKGIILQYIHWYFYTKEV